MIVQFLKDWRGIPAGSIRDIIDNFARMDLIPRGIAIEVPVPGEAIKEMKAPKDKMVRAAKNKRSVKI